MKTMEAAEEEPPLPSNFIEPGVCKATCAKFLTPPDSGTGYADSEIGNEQPMYIYGGSIK